MKRWGFVVIAALVVIPTAHADYRNAFLEQKAQAVRGSAVTVWCETDQNIWDKEVGPTIEGVSYADIQEIVLSPTTCTILAGPNDATNYDIATYIFMHELMHTAGIEDEGAADCLALWLLRFELRKNWGYTDDRANAAWQNAWVAHDKFAIGSPYRGACVQDGGVDPVGFANGLR